MTRYKLPDRFGGEEVRIIPSTNLPADLVMVEAAGGATFAFARGFLQRMDPPAEPPPNTTVVIKGLNNSDTRVDAFTRTGEPGNDGLRRWYWHDGRDWLTWEQVYDKGNPIVLTEAPS